MNIFEEIAESYKYNGIVSLKALDDDIVTLENQIDGYNSTLRELQLRGKKSHTLLEKIRDTKIRLSLLKAVYKQEINKTGEDGAIMEVLGVSGKNAKETDYPHTAADGKEPVPQNFEKAEIETVDENKTEPMSVSEDTISLDEQNNELIQDVPLKTLEENVSVQNVEKTEEETKGIQMGEAINLSDGVVIGQDKPEKDSAVVKNAIGENKEIGSVKTEDNLGNIPETVTVTAGNYKEVAEDHERISRYILSGFTEESNLFTRFKIEKDNGDNAGSVLKNETETLLKNMPAITGEEHNAAEEDNKIVETNNDNFSVDTKVTTDDSDFDTDFDVYKPFSDGDLNIVESVDLSNVTDMVNTMFIYSNVNIQKKLLHLKFINIRDYDVFVELLKQMEAERRNPLKRFLKKQKSIFIYVTTNVYGKEKCFKYEFTNCRIVDAIDGDYVSKAYIDNMTDPYGGDPNHHNCGVTFKYKKLIIT